MVNYEAELKDYHKNGYGLIHNFLSQEEVDELVKEMKDIVENLDLNEHRSIIAPGNLHRPTDYYMASGDKAGFFFEQKAFNEKGELILPRSLCLQKLGHGLHLGNEKFYKVTFNDRVKSVLKAINYQDPAVCQGIVVFKNPRTGSEVTPHKDLEFLFTEPVDSLCALWIALTDVTTENGCLEVIPGSHVEPPHRRFIRSVDENGVKVAFDGPPKEFEDSAFVPVPVPRGSCLVFDGALVHRSQPNTSDKPRPAYAVHVIDENKGKWSDKCWLQISRPFPKVY
ncbi:phytanoyl-CoA dioxygenase domain-containing protein 1 homolog [Panonychus citri]|uniref:phytanoyl-CoA dioxygenase domain-containing protein 1 homolog n=1 Tax=Panonychus citri TaxID=50023 RepID=UPI002307952C|nr:phytanoyl-CoA dioxygenase domain-containing protein 1 homolog [Panonychus citri]